MSVLVTGGAGFVGLNIAERLVGQGETVVSFDLGLPSKAAMAEISHGSGRFVGEQGDIRDRESVLDVMRRHDVTHVVHGAAITAGVEREAHQASLIAAVNFGGAIEVLEACIERGVKRVVLLSSGSVYGTAVKAEGLLDERDDLPSPDSLYGITKHAAERTGIRYRATRGLDVVVCRLGVVFGRWEHDTGVRDTLSIPMRLTEMAEEGAHAVLPERVPDDWVYADDVAAAVCTLLTVSKVRQPLYHIGTGRRWDALRWCDLLRERHPDFSFEVTDDPAKANVGRQAPTPRPPFSIERLRADTGYEPQFREEAAVADYLAWRGRAFPSGGSSAAGWPARES